MKVITLHSNKNVTQDNINTFTDLQQLVGGMVAFAFMRLGDNNIRAIAVNEEAHPLQLPPNPFVTDETPYAPSEALLKSGFAEEAVLRGNVVVLPPDGLTLVDQLPYE